MNTEQHQKTAKIYAFPLRGRAATRNTITDQDVERFKSYVDCGSWYHQEAIDEDRKAAKEGPAKLS